MKAHLAKLSLALLSTVFLLGCQEQGSDPVGPEGPQFDKPGRGDCRPKPHTVHCHGDDVVEDPNLIEALLFKNPSFTCESGATNTGGGEVGRVSWAAIFVGEAALPASDHIHYDLQLTGVAEGDYSITGNQFENKCAGVDIGTVKVKKNGKVVTPGNLQFEFPKHDAGGLTTHVWVTVSGPGGIFRSPAVEVAIPPHAEVQ